MTDTIAAIATAQGKGGVGIVRVSGPEVPALVEHLFGSLPPRQACLRIFKDAQGQTIDQGLALYFKAPHSFTGEHVLELQGHGGPAVLQLLLKQVMTAIPTIRQANAGEFSERAYLNDKMDLAQAEAVMDLINSSSAQAVIAAGRSLTGEFSSLIEDLLAQLIQLRLYIEAALDFPEEEIDFLADTGLQVQLQQLLQAVDQTLQRSRIGQRMTEGLSVVILGQPNVGKSSLLNALTGEDTAIVTDIAGTTRDVLKQQIQLDGLPVNIIDTAGLRETQDVVEQEGVRRAWTAVQQADRILLVTDAGLGIGHYEQQVLKQVHTQTTIPVDIIFNKVDTLQDTGLEQQVTTLTINQRDYQQISLSAKTRQGFQTLVDYLKQTVGFSQTSETTFTARARHVNALEATRQQLHQADIHLQQGDGELCAEALRLAQQSLGTITGTFSADDLLGEIFSSFCIGK